MKAYSAIIVIFALLIFSIPAFAETDGYETALKYYNSGKYKEAVRHLKAYTEKKPDASAYYMTGYSLYKLGRLNEATEYFNQAYLIDPDFSPEKTGVPQKYPRQKAKAVKKPLAAAKATPAPEQKPAAPAAQAVKQAPQPPAAKEVQPQKQAVQKAAVANKPSAPAVARVAPKSMKPVPAPARTSPAGLLAGINLMIIIGIAMAFYIYSSFCLFLIAKRLQAPYPWTAWIPLAQMWTLVGAAGKPWWWTILLFVPVVNIIAGIYIWILITENLGWKKWLGFLMLLPLVNLIFLGLLAFLKKTAGAPYPSLEEAPLSEEGDLFSEGSKPFGEESQSGEEKNIPNEEKNLFDDEKDPFTDEEQHQ